MFGLCLTSWRPGRPFKSLLKAERFIFTTYQLVRIHDVTSIKPISMILRGFGAQALVRWHLRHIINDNFDAGLESGATSQSNKAVVRNVKMFSARLGPAAHEHRSEEGGKVLCQSLQGLAVRLPGLADLPAQGLGPPPGPGPGSRSRPRAWVQVPAQARIPANGPLPKAQP